LLFYDGILMFTNGEAGGEVQLDLSQGGAPRRGKGITRLPRGRSAMSAADAAADQRERIISVMPRVVAEHGFSGTTVAHIVGAAAVGRAAFYQQFPDKRACFAAAQQRCHERLQGALTFPCYTKSSLAERVGSSLSAALEFLSEEPDVAVLIAVEAPGAGADATGRHLEWMRRYGELLRRGALGLDDVEKPPHAAELMIVGGIATAVAQKASAGEAHKLNELVLDYTEFVLTFYARSR
jgi:AcrR family transcriptional regulator